MTTPLPPARSIDLAPPDAAEVAALTRATLAAVRPPGGLTDLQRLLITAAYEAMTGHPAPADPSPGFDPTELGATLARRNEAFRTRILQTIILGALVLRPLPREVVEQVTAVARELEVDDGMLPVARRFAEGQLGLAAFDFDRNGYTQGWNPEQAARLHAPGLDQAWQQSTADAELAAMWDELEHLGPGSLGRKVWEFYRARGFAVPGRPGSAPPLLAQHDWVHVLADYGTRVEAEVEVFAFIARANDDPRGFSLLAMVVSLFETGYLFSGAGLFESFPGQLSRDGMTVRLADALRRGALSHGLEGAPDIDLMAVDWFALADRPLVEVRDALGITAKSQAAVAAGSVGPWEPGGISPFQMELGRSAAAARGEAHETYGASP